MPASEPQSGTSSGVFTWVQEATVILEGINPAGVDEAAIIVDNHLVKCLHATTIKQIEKLLAASKHLGEAAEPPTKPTLTGEILQENKFAFPGDCKFEELWKDPASMRSVLDSCRDRPGVKACYSYLLVYCEIMNGGFTESFYKRCETVNGTHQLARAVLSYALPLHKDKLPEGIRHNLLKGFDLFSARGASKFRKTFMHTWKDGGDALAHVMLRTLKELAHHLDEKQLKLLVENEALPIEEIAKEHIGSTTREEKISEQGFETAREKGLIVEFLKDKSGNPKFVSGKIQVKKKIPREIKFHEKDGTLTPDEAIKIKEWCKIHRYTLSPEELEKLKTKVSTMAQKAVFAEKVRSNMMSVLEAETTISEILAARRMTVLATDEWKLESKKKDADKESLFKSMFALVAATAQKDGLATALARRHGKREDFLAAITP